MDRRVLDVFREVFDDEELEIESKTSAKDIAGWDSLAQVKLIIGVEEAFDIKFTTNEVVSMTCVGDMINILRSKGISTKGYAG